MKDFQDAYGHEVYDHLLGKGGFEIVERDDGYFDATPGPRMYFSEYRDWPAIEKKAMRFVRGRVLDIGCGAGRHSLYLQNKGFDVLGIDNSPLAIKVCKLRGLKRVQVMPITKITSKLGRFSTILMLGNNFGLFGSFKRARWLLQRFHSIAEEKARIIAGTRDIYQTDEPQHLEYHERNRRRGRMPGQIRLRIRYKKYVTPWFDYLMVSQEEMHEILEGTGWKVERFLEGEGGMYIAVIGRR
jgi:cyclopropane fatty-acyl-phospholipid synthase-like methyltransferase